MADLERHLLPDARDKKLFMGVLFLAVGNLLLGVLNFVPI